MQEIRKKIVLIGDGYTGKTTIFRCLSKRLTPGPYKPTTIDSFPASVMVAGSLREIVIWDTNGQDEWAHIRRTAYLDCDLVILVFDFSDLSSLDNVYLKWVPELKECCPDARIILAGNKRELKKGLRAGIRSFEGHTMAKIIGAKGYIECSAVNEEGIDELFQKAVDTLFRSRFCTIL